MPKNVFAALCFLFMIVTLLWVSIPPWESSLVKEQGTIASSSYAPKGKIQINFETKSKQVLQCRAGAPIFSVFARTCPVEVLQKNIGKQVIVWHDRHKPYYIQIVGQDTALVTLKDFNQQIYITLILCAILLAMAGSALNQRN